MQIQRETYDRTAFARVFGLDPNALLQRSYRNEVALAFGMRRPVFHGQYGELDLYCNALAILIASYIRIDLRRSAGLVVRHWREVLDALARSERLKGRAIYSEGECFIVATNPDKTEVEAQVGPCQQAMDDISKRCGPDMVPLAIPLDLAAQQLRKAAKKARVKLPEMLTPGAPDSAEFRQWRNDIETYRAFASLRRDLRKKAKTPA